MTISLPASALDFVDRLVAQGLYNSRSDYLQALIRADARRVAEEELESQLMDGLASAQTEMTPAGWAGIRSEALTRRDATSP